MESCTGAVECRESHVRRARERSLGRGKGSAEMAPWYLNLLACPNCLRPLDHDEVEVFCLECAFRTRRSGQIDLRPTESRKACVSVPRVFEIKSEMLDEVDIGRPQLTFRGPKGIRDGSELLSVMQQTLKGRGRVLDLGCGPRDQAEPICFLGHQYVGIDLVSEQADLRADAHALPFQDASFDFVFSYTVLQHLHSPLVAIQEVWRVLKPGGIYCGTASQGDPFQRSFVHHTSWGILSLANAVGLRVVRLWACLDTLRGLARLGSYPRVIRACIRALDLAHKAFPFLAPRKMLWSSREKAVDELNRAAHIGFVIRKV